MTATKKRRLYDLYDLLYKNDRDDKTKTDAGRFYKSGLTGSFGHLDGEQLREPPKGDRSVELDNGGTEVTVLSEERQLLSDDRGIRAAKEFDRRGCCRI